MERKLCAGYTVFNGLELLEKSIRQIYNEVEVVLICWQKTSNKGNVSEEIEPFMNKFRGVGKIKLVEYYPDMSINTKANEIEKHNLMLYHAKKMGCTHFFLSATDHYYKTDEFIEAREFCYNQNLDLSFTKMYTYYKKPEWQLTPIENYHMPFIFKLHDNTLYSRVSGFPIYTDPSVQINTFTKWYMFHESEIMMHHYSMIRVDIENKFKNAAASIRWKQGDVERFVKEYNEYSLQANDGISYFGGRCIKEVPNYFDI